MSDLVFPALKDGKIAKERLPKLLKQRQSDVIQLGAEQARLEELNKEFRELTQARQQATEAANAHTGATQAEGSAAQADANAQEQLAERMGVSVVRPQYRLGCTLCKSIRQR